MRVAVFAKAPVAGLVKTRLIPLLGAEGAAALHERLVRHAMAIAVAADVGPVELWCAPDERHPFFAGFARAAGVALRVQVGADLGERMRHAFDTALSEGAAMVLIGSDCPAMGAIDVRRAVAALATHDVVLVPAEDGGYVLVGAARPVPSMFDGIDWGSDAVMTQTRERLAAAGARFCELPELWDVDRPADYTRMQQSNMPYEVAT